MVFAKKYVYTSPFDGPPSDKNIQLVEEVLPELQNGEVLFAAEYLTVDPYMRPMMTNSPVGTTMVGEQVSRVVASKNNDYKVGTHYLINAGWRSHTIIKPGQVDMDMKLLNDHGLPLSLALGTLGMTGASAYLGLVELLKPKAGDVVFVNAAAGAVGHVVGQVAKILGCKVIGCASSADKINWLKELGFDVVFNYKTDNLSEVLSEAAPNGINCFFDNVGEEFGNTVIRHHMAQFGRVAICGGISGYNEKERYKGVLPFREILMKSVTVKGFMVRADFTTPQWTVALDKMAEWIKEGKVMYREHRTEGFENMRSAFYDLFSGNNIGKAIVKV